MQTALEDTPGPVNVADARSGNRRGLVNCSLTDTAQLEPQVDGFSLFAIGRWRRRSRTPELTPVFCWLCPRGLGFSLRMIRPARGDPGGPVWSERVYGIPPEQVVGSTGRTTFELRDSGPVLVKTLDYLFVDDKAGKPVGIWQFIGRRPIACFGNSDGDLAMLQYTTINNPRPSFGLIVHHTDGDREYAYDAKPESSGKLVEALKEAPERGWTVVDMKNDWNRVFTFEQ